MYTVHVQYIPYALLSYISVHYISIVQCTCTIVVVSDIYRNLDRDCGILVHESYIWVRAHVLVHVHSTRTSVKNTECTCMYTSKDNVRRRYRTLVRLYSVYCTEYTLYRQVYCTINKIKLVYVAPATGTFQLTHSEYFANHVTFCVPWVVPDTWFLTSHVFWACDILRTTSPTRNLKKFLKNLKNFKNFLKTNFFEIFQNFPKITLIYLKFALKFCQAFQKKFQEFSEVL